MNLSTNESQASTFLDQYESGEHCQQPVSRPVPPVVSVFSARSCLSPVLLFSPLPCSPCLNKVSESQLFLVLHRSKIPSCLPPRNPALDTNYPQNPYKHFFSICNLLIIQHCQDLNTASLIKILKTWTSLRLLRSGRRTGMWWGKYIIPHWKGFFKQSGTMSETPVKC